MIDLQKYIAGFTSQYPYDENVFVMMRYRDVEHFKTIENTIRNVLSMNGLIAHFAKDKAICDILFDNILIYMHCCKYGIVVFEEIDDRDFNPNISFELGYMFSQKRRCLLLKEKRMQKLPSDICGHLYKDFDLFNIKDTITKQVNEWIVKDLGIDSPKKNALKNIIKLFTDSSPKYKIYRSILWLLHSNKNGIAYSTLKKAIYYKDSREGSSLRKAIRVLNDYNAIVSVANDGETGYKLTDLGIEAVAQRKNMGDESFHLNP